MSTFAKLSFSTTGIIACLISHQAVSHGYAEFPPARQVICHDDGGYWSAGGKDIPNAACKAAYDKSGTYPFVQINEYAALVKDYLNIDAVKAVVKDGLLCSAGSEAKAGISIPASYWQQTEITPDAEGYIHFVWKATAPHSPSFWQFYLTKDNHDFEQALRWSDLDLIDNKGNITVDFDRKYRMKVKMPDERDGRAILFTRWQRADPAGEGFYNCSDISFSANGSSGENTDSPVDEQAMTVFYDHGYFIPQGYPSPIIGDYISFRGFRDNKGEVLEERLLITQANLSTWPKDMADLINSKHAGMWAIGVKNSAGTFTFNKDNIHANQVWSTFENDSFILSIIPKPVDDDTADEAQAEEAVDQGSWNADKIYYDGDTVQYAGSTWRAYWWTLGEKPTDSGPNGVWRKVETGVMPWNSEKIYHADDKVNHKDKEWTAQWWTRGEEPGTTGEWGVWR